MSDDYLNGLDTKARGSLDDKTRQIGNRPSADSSVVGALTALEDAKDTRENIAKQIIRRREMVQEFPAGAEVSPSYANTNASLDPKALSRFVTDLQNGDSRTWAEVEHQERTGHSPVIHKR
jgi:hypothetical protein